MKKEIWVIVANSTHAKIYKAESNKSLKEISSFEHPESRLHEQDLVTSKPGRAFDSIGTARHAVQQKTSAKEQEFIHFAKQLSSYLENSRNKGDFQSLYVIASPNFLGLLRQEFTPQINHLIAGEIVKDMTSSRIEQIRDHLPLVL